MYTKNLSGTFATAEQLVKDYEEASTKKESLPWTRPTRLVFLPCTSWRRLIRLRRINCIFNDKRLGGQLSRKNLFCDHLLNPSIELAVLGIGVHHAGLTTDDRRAIEDLYLKGSLRVVVATSVRPLPTFPATFVNMATEDLGCWR